MGYVEVFQMDNEGAGWVSLDALSIGDKVEIELSLMSNPVVQLLCPVCLVPVASGQGTSLCESHR
jgi:hypothetical protein